MFWYVVFGGLLIFLVKEWELLVLIIVNLVQVIIGFMILGVYIGFGLEVFCLGSNLMLLLCDIMNILFFVNVDYVSLFEGIGFNFLF